ncbi:phage late control D family protein [Pantoea wallisii]|uniref:phage late control D family protein n=1 Tax=Pantoea wallisii TaxID=1076551 RepID=UPI0026B4D202
MINPLSNVLLQTGAQLTPDFSLSVNAQDITTNVRQRLISLTLTDNRGFEADQLNIELDDADGQLMMPALGEELQLSLGWQGFALTDKGRFTVDSIQHHGAPDALTLTARSANFLGSLNQQREVSYDNTTLGEIVAQIAARNHLQPHLAAGFAGISVLHIDQTHESDAGFMTRLATLYGAVAAVKAGKLLFIRPGNGTSVSGKPIAPVILTRKEGDAHSFNLAGRDGYTGVTAHWLSTKASKPQQVNLQRKTSEQAAFTVDHPAAKTPGMPAVAKPGQENYLAGSKENVFTLTTLYPTKELAMRAAEAKWKNLQQGHASVSLKLAKGRADLFPETPVTLSGFKTVIDRQPWLITKVTHLLNAGGFITQLECEILLENAEYEAKEK